MNPTESLPEPWLRGVVPELDPVVGHLLRASQQIQEEVTRAIAPLTKEQLWSSPHGMTSAGFHVKHLAGSTGRLCTYLEGRQLDAGQLEAMRAESAGNESAADLLALVQTAFERYQRLVRTLHPENFGEIREIGRKRLPTTAVSLAIHIAEHGQRHAGQAISASKLARAEIR